MIVVSAVIDCLASLSLSYPKLDKKERQELEAARQILLSTD